MNNKLGTILKNFSVTFAANIVSMLVSMVVVFFLSKDMSVTDYGYWQLYLLFSSYISFIHLGIPDGYYLRFSGQDYGSLDKGVFASLFRFLGLLTLIIFGLSLPVLFISRRIGSESLTPLLLSLTALAAFFVIPRVFIQFAWQAAARFRDNAMIIIIERGIFLAGVFLFMLFRMEKFIILIALDLTAKALALGLSILKAKDLVFARPAERKVAAGEIRENVTAGMSLMLASLSSSFLIGLNQLVIKAKWGIDTYSKIALTLSLSNLLMVFINALALVLLPFIRRSDENMNLKLHLHSRKLLVLVLFICLNAYYPFRLFASFWLPRYSEGIAYMAILFPLCIFESKNQLLTNTFLKNYRRERAILKANVLSLALCALLLGIFAFGAGNLFLTVLSLLVTIAFRSCLSEYYLSQKTGQSYFKENAGEILMTAVFVAGQWFIGGIPGALVYFAATLVYLFLSRRAVAELWTQVQRLFRRSAI